MQSQQAGDRPRTVWILTHRRLGDLNQMLALTRALGWPATVKRLAFHLPKLARAPFAARRLIAWSASDPLEPPWPDLVMCAEARASTVARLLKERSRGKLKTVCLGRPAGSPAGFDLVLTTAQYRLPAAPNVTELDLPIGAMAAESVAAPALPGAPAISRLSRPLISVLVGGTSPPDVLDGEAARALGGSVVEYARRRGGTLLVATSPRTGKAAAAALAEAIPAPHVVHLWEGGDENPYWQFLKEADEIVVTSDSVSMTVEAIATGKAVSVYRLPQYYSLRHRIIERLYRARCGAFESSGWLRPISWFFDSGLIEVRPDRRLLLDRLVAQGRLAWYGDARAPVGAVHLSANELTFAASTIRDLFSEEKSYSRASYSPHVCRRP